MAEKIYTKSQVMELAKYFANADLYEYIDEVVEQATGQTFENYLAHAAFDLKEPNDSSERTNEVGAALQPWVEKIKPMTEAVDAARRPLIEELETLKQGGNTEKNIQ